MHSNLPQPSKSKAKSLSKWFLAFSIFFVAGLTLHSEDSDAARRPQVRKASAKKVTKRRGTVKRRNNGATPAGVFALYQNALFGYGKCLPSLEESAAKVLARNGINTVSAAENERAALAKGIAQVERLLGKPIPKDYRYHYQWKEASGAWNSGLSRVGYVTVKRPRGSAKGTLTGRMMHELGHRFGHANNNENYNEYRQHMRGKKCMITTYCGKSLNEEFAEVFEAYVVNPDFLAKHCPDSYAYFKNKLFRNSDALLASCEDPNSILEEHDGDDDEAIEDTNEQQIDEKKDFTVALPETGPMPMRDPRYPEVATPEVPATTTDGTAQVPQEPAIEQGAVDQPAEQGVSVAEAAQATQEAPNATATPTPTPTPAPTPSPTPSAAQAQWKAYEPAAGAKIPTPTFRPAK